MKLSLRRPASFVHFCALVCALASPLACNPGPDPAANFVVSSDPASPGLQSVAPYNYGDVALTASGTRVFAITNAGDLPGTLTAVTDAALGLAAPFATAPSVQTA